jgi:pilus assembly protein CpaE
MPLPSAPARRPTATKGGEAGQAAVELVGLLPLLVLLALGAWQAVVAGQAAWLAAGAARASARAAAVGDDPATAARRTLPPALERGLRITTATSGTAVTVRIGIPNVVLGGRLTTIRSSSEFPEQRS